MIWLPNSFQGAVLVPAPSDLDALTQRFCDVAGIWTDEDQKVLGLSEEKIRPTLAMRFSDPSAGARRQAVAPVSLCPPLPPIGSTDHA